MPREKNSPIRAKRAIDVDVANLKSSRKTFRVLNVLRPYTGSKSCFGVIASIDDFFVLVPRLHSKQTFMSARLFDAEANFWRTYSGAIFRDRSALIADSMPRTAPSSGMGWERSRQHVRNYGTKRLFRHDFGVFWRVINDCWLNEIAFGAQGLFTASYKPVPLAFAIF